MFEIVESLLSTWALWVLDCQELFWIKFIICEKIIVPLWLLIKFFVSVVSVYVSCFSHSHHVGEFCELLESNWAMVFTFIVLMEVQLDKIRLFHGLPGHGILLMLA